MHELDAPLELLPGAAGVGQEHLACLGRIGPLADALEQGQPQISLELAHLHAHRRLREPELARRQ